MYTNLKREQFNNLLLLLFFSVILLTTLLFFNIFSLLIIFVVGAIVAGRFKWFVPATIVLITTLLHMILVNYVSALAIILILGSYLIPLAYCVTYKKSVSHTAWITGISFGSGLIFLFSVLIYMEYGNLNMQVINNLFNSVITDIQQYFQINARQMFGENTAADIVKSIPVAGNIIKKVLTGIVLFICGTVGICGSMLANKIRYSKAFVVKNEKDDTKTDVVMSIKVLDELEVSKTAAVIMFLLILSLIFLTGDEALMAINVYLAFLPIFVIRGIKAIISIFNNPQIAGSVFIIAILFLLLTGDPFLSLSYLGVYDRMRKKDEKVD